MKVGDYINIIKGINERERVGYDSNDVYRETASFTICWAEMVRDDSISEPDLIRLQVNPDGKFDIVDFTTARRSGRLLYQNVPQESIPTWMIEAISILRIAETNSVVQGVGFKVSDKLYYIVDKRGENEQS